MSEAMDFDLPDENALDPISAGTWQVSTTNRHGDREDPYMKALAKSLLKTVKDGGFDKSEEAYNARQRFAEGAGSSHTERRKNKREKAVKPIKGENRRRSDLFATSFYASCVEIKATGEVSE